MLLSEIINMAEGAVKTALIAFSTEMVRNAIRSLSHTELKAVKAILRDRQVEKIYSAKEVATTNDITRSILVGAMDKLVCAGLVQTRSLGVKGSYVKVLNQQLFDIVEAA